MSQNYISFDCKKIVNLMIRDSTDMFILWTIYHMD